MARYRVALCRSYICVAPACSFQSAGCALSAAQTRHGRVAAWPRASGPLPAWPPARLGFATASRHCARPRLPSACRPGRPNPTAATRGASPARASPPGARSAPEPAGAASRSRTARPCRVATCDGDRSASYRLAQVAGPSAHRSRPGAEPVGRAHAAACPVDQQPWPRPTVRRPSGPKFDHSRSYCGRTSKTSSGHSARRRRIARQSVQSAE